jgi:hypothetical protein
MVAQESPQELATKVMEQANEKYREVSIADMGKTMRETQETLQAINDGLAKTNTLGDVPLADVFYIHEGLLNAENANFYDDIAGDEQTTSTFTVDVYDDGSGQYYIESADFVTFYNDLAAEIDLEIDEANGEALIIASLELTGLDLNGGGATFTLSLNPGLVQPPWYTPIGSLPAYSQNGDDAAALLRLYTQDVHGFFENNPCPTGKQPFAAASLHYHTFFAANPFPSLYTTGIEPYFWRSNTADPIGDDNDQVNNNQIWYSWYAKMDQLVNVAVPTFNSLGNRSFYRTDFKSYSSSNPPQGMPTFPSENYFHGGRFFYPICGCF